MTSDPASDRTSDPASGSPFKPPTPGTDTPGVTPEIAASMRYLLDQLVSGIPGVSGALVASVDGFSLAESLPPRGPHGPTHVDPAGLAAMSAAALGVANRMVGAVGVEPVRETTLHSPSGYVIVHRVGSVAALTVLAGPAVDVARVHLVARELANGVERLLRGAEWSVAHADAMQRA